MDIRLYKIVIVCPVCEKTIEMIKVKISKLKIIKTDSDFFINYKDINPVFYEVFVCKHCGYAEFQDRFLTVTEKEKKFIGINITDLWAKKDYSVERDIEKALETFILLYVNLRAKNAPDIIIAKALIRIAWLYRMKNDPREKDCMICAAESFANAFTNQNFPIGKMDECTCVYLIGELYRRAGKYRKALKWFSFILGLPSIKEHTHVRRMVADQMLLLKNAFENKDAKDE